MVNPWGTQKEVAKTGNSQNRYPDFILNISSLFYTDMDRWKSNNRSRDDHNNSVFVWIFRLFIGATNYETMLWYNYSPKIPFKNYETQKTSNHGHARLQILLLKKLVWIQTQYQWELLWINSIGIPLTIDYPKIRSRKKLNGSRLKLPGYDSPKTFMLRSRALILYISLYDNN